MLLYVLLCFGIVVIESLFSIVKVYVLCVIVWHLVCVLCNRTIYLCWVLIHAPMLCYTSWRKFRCMFKGVQLQNG